MAKHRVTEADWPEAPGHDPDRREEGEPAGPSRRRRVTIIVLLACAVVAAAVGVGIGVTRNKPVAGPTTVPAPAPTTALPNTASYVPTWDSSGQYKLVFHDEFSGSVLNTAEWVPGWFGNGVTAPVDSNDYAANSSANVSVSDGSLNLKLTKQSVEVGGKTYPYTGALVNTNGKFSFSYGSIEFRAWVPAAADGNVADWPALWTDGQNWPVDGENDIFEAINGSAAYHFHSGSEGSDGNPNNGSAVSEKISGWHTFGADWQPGKVRYYYDNQLVGTLTTGITGAPQYIVIGLGNGPGSRPAAGASELRVDWVRVWKDS
jgi:beta-glucanase (GH16 family)